jgi:hypothetical protein
MQARSDPGLGDSMRNPHPSKRSLGGPPAITILIGAIILAAAVGKCEVYHNKEFGIAVSVPMGALLCPTPTGEHDHGPVFLLASKGLNDCSQSEQRRSIEIFASYNAADATKKLDDFLQWECVNVARGPCQPAPTDLHITGLKSAAASVKHADGWVDIIVVTQAGTPDSAFDASAPSINYELRLHTNVDHLDDDLQVFRTILKTLQLQPGPRSGG